MELNMTMIHQEITFPRWSVQGRYRGSVDGLTVRVNNVAPEKADRGKNRPQSRIQGIACKSSRRQGNFFMNHADLTGPLSNGRKKVDSIKPLVEKASIVSPLRWDLCNWDIHNCGSIFLD
jgi:hypothetical protein